MRHPNNGLTSNTESNSEKSQDLLIYPNPASISITINNPEGKFINIYDVMGKSILTTISRANLVIDISDWNKGLYFIRSNGQTKIFSKN